MNTIQRLRAILEHQLPGVWMRMETPPLLPTGVWWLDIVFNDRHVIIEWKGGQRKIGFSLSDEKPEEHYGHEEPDETADSIDAAVRRIRELVSPPEVKAATTGAVQGRVEG
jgi:hypothetical protein